MLRRALLFGCIALIGGAGNPSVPFIGIGGLGGAVSAWLTVRSIARVRTPR